MRTAMMGARFAEGGRKLVVVTEWNEFRAIAPVRSRAAMRGTLIVDLRKMSDSATLRAAGFRHKGIGRA